MLTLFGTLKDIGNKQIRCQHQPAEQAAHSSHQTEQQEPQVAFFYGDDK